MKRLALILSFIALALAHQAYAQSTSSSVPVTGLIHPQQRPLVYGKPIPSTAAFFMLDPLAVDRLEQQQGGTIAIPDFHLSDHEQATLVLEHFQVLANGAPVMAGTAAGDKPAEIDRGAFFKGRVEGIAGSYVYLAIFRNYCSGYIEIPTAGDARRRLTIAPLDLRDEEQSTMVTYEETEALAMQGAEFLRKGDWTCGAETIGDYQQNVDRIFKNYEKSLKSKAPRTQSNTLLVAQVAIDCDGEYYVAHSRNLSRAANYALTVMGAVSAMYQRDVNVAIQVPYLRVWTGTDPYPGTTTSTLLPQFRTYWNTNMSGVQRTLVHLFSVSSTGGGIAYLSGLCASPTNGFGYAVIGLNNNVTYPTTAYVWDSDVTSHEMGHQFGSPHTHSCNWNPAIDSCYAAEGNCFTGTNPRVGTVMSYCHLTSFGTQLYFHPRVATLIRTNAEAANCISALNGSTGNDVAVSDISVPAVGGKIMASANFTPTATFINPGTNNQTGLSVTFVIKDSAGVQKYTNTQPLASLAAGATATVNFLPTSLATIARYSSTVTISLPGDGFTANNTMVRQFEIVANTSGSFTITSPNTSVVYKAGSTVNITWTSTGTINSARLDFTPNDGASWYTIHTDLAPGTGSFSWVVPPVATTQARVRISDRDNASTSDESDQMFTITTLPLDWQWARSAGSTLDDDVRAVATDANGNVYIAGTFADTLRLDTLTLVSGGGTDAFVAKYTAGGTIEWARRFGGSGNDSAMGVAVDASGNVFLAGGFFNTVIFSTTTLTSAGDQDMFLAKYDRNGNPQWAQRAGSSGRDQARAVAADNNGNALITGTFSGSLTLGAQTFNASGSSDAFVAHFSSAGNADWAQRVGGTDSDEGNGIAVDGSGNSVVIGRYRQSATVGGTTLTSAGSDDAFIVKYNTTGAAQWAVTAGGNQADEGHAVAIDNSGNVLVTGFIAGTVQFGTVYSASAGARDVFVAKYNSSGSLQWARRSGNTGNDWGNGIAVDGVGNSYVIGYFQDAFRIGSLSVTSPAGGNDIFVAKYSADGLPVWVQRGGGPRGEEAYGITANSNGDNVYMVGRFTYTPPGDQPSVYGADQLTGLGLNDVVIGRLGMFKILSPVQGDHWQVGASKSIVWSTVAATNVKVEYSVDNGTTWITITPSTPNTGSFAIVVPNHITSQATVRVTDADNPSLYGSAQSGTFNIDGVAPPFNLVATPHNASVSLTWSPSPSEGVTNYAIYRGDLAVGVPPSNLVLLTTVGGAQLTYSDQTVTNCNSYIYAAKALVGPYESTFSNLDTARPTQPGTITSLSPITGEHVPASSNKLVGWLSTGCIDEVHLQLSTDRGATWTPIVAATTNTGAFVWPVPAINSARAIIRISDLADSTVFGITDTFTICGPSATVAVTGPTTLCEGDSITLSAPKGYGTYIWSNNASTRQIVVKKAGSYTVTVADSNGCNATSQPVAVTINTVLAPKVDVTGSLAFCDGDTTMLDAGAGYAHYIWSTGDTTRTIRVAHAGTYFARVTSGGGCSGVSDTVAITVHTRPAKPVISRKATGDSLLLSAPTGTIQWTLNGSPLSGASSRSIRIRQVGSYQAIFVDSNGCSSISQAIVVESVPASVAIETGERHFAIHPNPSGGLFTFEAELEKPGSVLVTLVDMTGKELFRTETPRASGDFRKEIDARTLPAGVYILDVHSGDQNWTRKIVIQ